jgi:DNA-binding CsgD family transcriptional regulator
VERPEAAAGEEVVGRETELQALRRFLDGAGARSFVIAGEPGIGKTTLWQAGLAIARERGFRVFSTRASEAEARLAFAALIDLLDEVDGAELARLPAPQRRALEVALLRAEAPEQPSLDPGAIAVGLLNALRALGDTPLVVAVDDFPWLDGPSAEALTFAARRLDGNWPLFLLARRPGPGSPLEHALGIRRLDRLDLGPLSYGAIRQLLAERLGLVVPRHLLRRLLDTTLGNPLFALEMGRELARHDLPAVGEDLPVPDAVEDLLGTRVARLPVPTRRLLLATALSAELTTTQLCAIADARTVEDAVDAGVLAVESGRVRASHPLLGAAAKKRSRTRERRELHRRLADVAADEQLRARHLALATGSPDDGLAATVAVAAAAAWARGAREEAGELAEHALRLTPPGAPERVDRLLALAGYLSVTGQERRLAELLRPELDSLPTGVARARACLLLLDTALHVDEGMNLLDRALADCPDVPLRARLLAMKAAYLCMCSVERIPDADAWAQEAWAEARGHGAEVELDVLHGFAWTSILRGRPVDALGERWRTLSASEPFLLYSVDRVAGIRLSWRGHVGEARQHLRRLMALADERGEASSYAVLRLQLCELELRAGEWDAAARVLGEWAESGDRELVSAISYERCLALLAAGRGRPDEVEKHARHVTAEFVVSGVRWGVLEMLRARGIAALLAHEPQRAADSLRAVWSHTETEGVADPGAFPAAPDLVEALVESGEMTEARAVTDRLRVLGEEQQHPWARTSTKRCAGLVVLSEGYEEGSEAALTAAAGEYAELGLRFDAARTWLALGRAQRRHRKWAAARRSLERAAAGFDEIGSPGWAQEARSELERLGARRPGAAGQLTPTELRVAGLAAEGLSNKEIAQQLVVTVNTVETHLSHAYAKLGIRSRAQLSRVDLER